MRGVLIVLLAGGLCAGGFAEEVFRESPRLFPGPAVWRNVEGTAAVADHPFHDPMPVVYVDGLLYRNAQKLSDINRIHTFWYYPEEELQLAGDGFFYVEAQGARFAVIFGGGYYADCFVEGEEGDKTDLGYPIPGWIKAMGRRQVFLDPEVPYEENVHCGTGFWVMEDGIASITVPSSLEEEVRGERVVYGPERMRFPFAAYAEFNVVFHNDVLAWVEDEPGPGTGMEIRVEFDEPRDNLIVLNGFVDLRRRHLYKMNARMKTMRIRGEGFELRETLPDEVRFHRVNFPGKTAGVTITVEAVYPGSRWEDMAVTALFSEVRPEPDEEELSRLTEKWVRQAEWIREQWDRRKSAGAGR